MGLSAVPLSPDPWWRTISEPTFLMCSPELYDVSYVINPWMEGNINRSCRKQAMAQWEQLYYALAAVAQVELVEPQPGSPLARRKSQTADAKWLGPPRAPLCMEEAERGRLHSASALVKRWRA